MNDLINRIKAREAKEAQQLKKDRPLWALAAAMFLLIFVGLLCFPPDGLQASRLWFMGVLAAVYVLNAVLLARKLRQLRRVDYTEPVRTFIGRAEQRLQFMLPLDRWIAGSGLVILGVVAGFYVIDAVFRRLLGPGHECLAVALYCAGYLLLCALGFTFTYRNWKASKAPLLRDLRELKRDLLAGEPGSTSV